MSPTASGKLARWRILVVEDEYFIADDMTNALKALGAEVVGPVQTREKALSAVASGPLTAAVLDISLRGESAFAVADALTGQGIPFVFATGYAPALVPAEYGHVPRWEKPFDPRELARALPAILQSAQQTS